MPRLSVARLLSLFLITCTVGFTLYIFTSKPLNSAKRNEDEGEERGEIEENLLLQQQIKVANETFDSRYIFYNRVPKCGSMSMTTLFYRLGGENKFRVASPYEAGEQQDKNEEEEEEFTKFLTNEPHPFVYIRHLYFIDFTKYNRKQPMYVNIMRDPIERFESFYYFTRFGNTRGGGGSRMGEERRQETIDDCVRLRRHECMRPYWQVVPYFCGNNPGCSSRSKWAVDTAKNNIENHYLFVGLIEELDVSLDILENLIPRYFDNARGIYHMNPENTQVKKDTKTNNKKPTSDQTKKFLREETSLKLEYELYDFVKTRFYAMADSL